MSNSFTQVFGGTTIYPSDVSYLPLALDANISLEWPLDATAGSNVVARIIDITPTGAYTITMPDATAVSVGQTVLFNNIGPSTVAVNKADGAGILSIAAGQQWQAYLIDNTTVGGTWRTLRYGASTAQAQAAALAGPGLVTDGALLAQNYEVIDLSATPYTLTNPDRAKVFVWTGGLGTLNLPPASSAGDGWFVQVRNAGQGDLIIDPSSSELINASSTLRLQPGDSAVVVGDGAQWYTIGFGQQAVFAFDYTSVAVTGGTYTLSGSELNRIAYKFTGALTSNVTIVVPATVQQYWVNNATTGAFTLSLRASGSGSSTLVTQASTSILYCDGTTIVPATTAVTFAGILPVTQGGTGANNAPSALTNLGGTGIGTAVFTATTTAAARTAIAAASSGANSDITSLTGLTTPLSVGQGGTGTATAFTAGSVVFAGASGVYTQNNANLFWDNTNVRLGIGTASPTFRLQVETNTDASTGAYVRNSSTGTAAAGNLTVASLVGNISIRAHSAANSAWPNSTLIISDSGFTGGLNLFQNGANPIRLWTNGTERMRIDSAGNVGIGTASPITPLDVTGTTRSGNFRVNAGGSVTGAGIWGIDTILAFNTGSTERARIDASGNFGIGTSVPASRLHVVNSSIADQLRLQDVPTDATIKYGVVGGAHYTNAEEPITLIMSIGDVTANSIVIGGGVSTMNSANNIIFRTAANNTTLVGTERMRINSAGDVVLPKLTLSTDTPFLTGANINSGANPLAIGTSGAGVTAFFTNNSERMRVTNAGDVGIGTVSPNYKLEVRTDAVSAFNWVGSFNNTATGSFGAGFLARSSVGSAYFYMRGDGLAYVENATNNALGFSTNATEKMRITAAGDVGVGTISPSAKLEVARTDAAAGIRVTVGSGAYSGQVALFGVTGISNGYYITKDASNNIQHIWDGTAGAERMRITSAGDVGIGTTAPSGYGKLAVIGGNLGVSQDSTTVTTIRGNANVGNIGAFNSTGASLTFSTAPSGSGEVERMRIDSAGQVGIGTTPSAWVSSWRAVDVNAGGGALFSGLALSGIANNAYFDSGSNWRYKGSYGAGSVSMGSDGSISILNAGAGTAGNIITFTTRIYVSPTGDVGIGNIAPGQRLSVGSISATSAGIDQTTTTTTFSVVPSNSAAGGTNITYSWASGGQGPLRFSNASTEVMRLDASGNLGIGTTAPASRLHAAGITRISDATNSTAIAIDAVTTAGLTSITSQFGGSELALGSATVERVRIKAGGQVRFIPLAAAPASPQAGDVYYDSTTNKLRCYNGTIWNDLF